jgi:cytidylate kinase
MKTIIGISGKIGTGKNYLAQKLKKEFERMGYSTAECSFAASLKNELNTIINLSRIAVQKELDCYSAVAEISKDLRMPQKDVTLLISIIEKDLKTDFDFDAHSRKKSIRRALQILGTEVRRSKDENYWVKSFHRSLPKADYIFVTDVRFPNEADSIIDKNGIVIRLEIPAEVVAERVQGRDGLQYSEEVKQHASETSLDDYEHFDLIVGKDFVVNELVEYIQDKIGETR